jgi:hypothetical protein
MTFKSAGSCSASRSVIYTGLHTHESGQYVLNNNRHHFIFDHVVLAVGYIDPHRDLTRSEFGNTENLADPRIKLSSYTPADVNISVFLSDVPEVREGLTVYY